MDNERKPTTININLKSIYVFIGSCFISFIFVFLLEHLNTLNCVPLWPRTIIEDKTDIDNLIIAYDNHVLKLKQKYETAATKELAAYYYDNYQGYTLNQLGKIVSLKSIDYNALTRPQSYDPCATQSYNDDFKSFFGNTIWNDQHEKRDYNYNDVTNEAQKQNSIQYGNIVYTDSYLKAYYNDPPDYSIETKYREFNNKFSLCDCSSYKNKLKLHLKATYSDILFVILISILLTSIFLIVKKYNIKIRLTK